MKISLLPIGKPQKLAADTIFEDLKPIIPHVEITVETKAIALPKEAHDEEREQYRSFALLPLVHDYAVRHQFDKVLGITDVDIYALRLNFVFGEAERRGRAALISLCRLRPEFYGAPADERLFLDRVLKEAVHELGHTFGLVHCPNPYCVMYFSNSIFETDRKQSVFCNRCDVQLERVMREATGEGE